MRALVIMLALLGCDTSALDRFRAAPDGGGDGGSPDFSLSTSTPFVFVRQGAIQTASIVITRIRGFGQSVSVSVNGLPAGVTIDSLTISGESASGTLTFHAAATATQGGPVTLIVTGNAAGLSRTAMLDLVVAGQPGTPDLSFGTQGRVITTAGMGSGATGLVLQPDRKIVVCAAIIATCFSQIQFGAYRYNPDGSLDSGFGAGGRATFGVQTQSLPGAIALQADGKLVLAGQSGMPPLNGPSNWALIRFTADGSVDGAFGSGGAVERSFGSAHTLARGVAVQGDGRIVAVGDAPGGFVAARYLRDGTADASFAGGVVATPIGAMTTDKSLAVALDGDRFVVVGPSAGTMGDKFAFVRYKQSDGSLDPTFGNGGLFSTDIGGFPTALTLYSDGKILAVGGKSYSFNAPDNRIVIARLNVNGSPDFSFGTLGAAVAPNASVAHSVLLEDDGAIVVAGQTITPMSTTRFAVSRFLPDGTPDPSFGSATGPLAGTVEFDFGGQNSSSDGARGIARERDGRIIAAGFGTLASGESALVVVRVWP